MGIYRTQRPTLISGETSTSKIVFVHLILVVSASAYALFGAYVFHTIEGNFERSKDASRNESLELIKVWTQQIINGQIGSSTGSLNISFLSVDNSSSEILLYLRFLEHITRENELSLAEVVFAVETGEEVQFQRKWAFPSAILFAFTVITTIGYGNIAPSTFSGRLFCIFYGIVGIPLTMLAIADCGKFTSDAAVAMWHRFLATGRRFAKSTCNLLTPKSSARQMLTTEKNDDGEPDDAVFIATLFLAYVFLGAAFLPLWEDLQFFDAVYFSFVTLTTIGFGDIVPQRYMYLFPTLLYIVIGLALTTMTIESAGLYFRKLHYLGQKLRNSGKARIWFGGKSLTTEELVQVLGRELGVDSTRINDVTKNLDSLVDNAVNDKHGVMSNEIPPADTEESLFNVSFYLNAESLPFVDDDVSTYKSDRSSARSYNRLDRLETL